MVTILTKKINYRTAFLKNMYLDNLTMNEFKSRLNEKLVVILPIGAVEEHGSHLPLCTDSIQPEFIAEKVAEKTNSLIAPPIRYGVCMSTKNFPGTISIKFDTLRSLIYDILSELVRNGVKNILVLSGHAGRLHMSALKLAAYNIVEEENVKVAVLSDYDFAYIFKEIEFPKDDGHAGAIETSRVLSIREDLVKGKGINSHVKFPKFFVLNHIEKFFPSGVMGMPSHASKEKGKLLNDFIVDEIVKLVENFQNI